jgi:hypothetical protein
MKLTRAAAWTTAGVLSAGTVFGITYTAFADSGSGSDPNAGPNAAASPDRQGPNRQGPNRHPGILARVEHGQFTARVKQGNEQFELQRGTVLAVSPTSIQVQSVDGYGATYQITTATHVRKDRKAASISEVHVGDRVGVLADSSDNARWVRDAGPAPARPQNDNQNQTQG